MSVQVLTFKSQYFQNDVNALSFKANNFTFKQTRNLAIMLENGTNISHLIKTEKHGFDKPLFIQKIQKELYVLLILEQFSEPEIKYKITFLRAFSFSELNEIIERFEYDETLYSAFSFKDFWV